MQVEIFKFQSPEEQMLNEIRTVEIEVEIWFVASDVAKTLGYKNAPDAISRHCKIKGIVKHDSLKSEKGTSIQRIPTSFLTVVITVIAFLTILMNYQDSKIYNITVDKLYKKVDSLELEQLNTSKKIQDLKNSFQQTEYYQTSIQKSGKN